MSESLKQLADSLNIATAQLSGDPRRLQLALGQVEDRKRREEEEARRAAILNAASTNPELAKFTELLGAFKGAEAYVSRPSTKDRKIVKGIDGFNYFADTGERVLPGIESTDKEFDSKKDAAGYLRYTEGPDKGKRVFPDVETPDPVPDIKDEASLRKEFNDQSKYFKGIAQSFGKVAATDPTAAGDVSLIFAYMKMLDPGSVVREGEQATAANARGVPERITSLYNRVLTGERLTEPQRADFRKQAQNIYDLALKDQSLVMSRYKSIAEQKGFNPNVIVFDYSESIQPLIFEMSLKEKSLEDLQSLDAANYNDEQLEIIAKILAQKLSGS